MGKITVFSALDTCPFCKKAKTLLEQRGVKYEEISVSARPEWRQFMFLLTNGRSSLPEVFFNDRLIGGSDELEKLEQSGELDQKIKECLDAPNVDFPPPFRKPKSEEFLKLIPVELVEKWQRDLEAIDSKLGGTSEKPISSLLIMLETPEQMVVLCTAGPGREVFIQGAGGNKGSDGSEQKSYCQVVLEKKETLFIDDPLKVPGLARNNDWVTFGYGYYVGAPWIVGRLKGTVVAMEKEAGILKQEHKEIIETLRDQLESELQHYTDTLS